MISKEKANETGFTVTNLLTWKIKKIWTTVALASTLMACNSNSDNKTFLLDPNDGSGKYNIEYQFDGWSAWPDIVTLDITTKKINDSTYTALIEKSQWKDIKIKASSLEELQDKIIEKAVLDYAADEGFWTRGINHNTQTAAESKTADFMQEYSKFLKELPKMQDEQNNIKTRKAEIEQEIANLKQEKKELEKKEKWANKVIKIKR